MTDETTPVQADETTSAVEAVPAAASADTRQFTGGFARGGASRGRGGPGGRGGDRGRGGRDGGRRDARPERKTEFDQKTISVRRVARVMAGGRRFNFSVAIVAGDKKGRVGVGLGKAGDTAAAIDKALRDAKKHMIKIPLTDNKSIPHEVTGKHGSSSIAIRPAKGRGLVAGASARVVLELGGVTDVTAKIHTRSRNTLSNARAAVEALKTLRPNRVK